MLSEINGRHFQNYKILTWPFHKNFRKTKKSGLQILEYIIYLYDIQVIYISTFVIIKFMCVSFVSKITKTCYKIQNLSFAKFVDAVVFAVVTAVVTSGLFVCRAVPVCAPSTGFDIGRKRRAARAPSSSPKFSLLFCVENALRRKWKAAEKQNAIKSEWWRWQWLLEYNNFNNAFVAWGGGATEKEKNGRVALEISAKLTRKLITIALL